MDKEAIIATVLDYFEGWFDGDPVRMERALHPQLAKRGVKPDGAIHPITADQMIQATREGMGKQNRPADLKIEVKVDDVFGDIATATVYSAVFVEYAQLVKTAQGWKILNTLYKRR